MYTPQTPQTTPQHVKPRIPRKFYFLYPLIAVVFLIIGIGIGAAASNMQTKTITVTRNVPGPTALPQPAVTITKTVTAQPPAPPSNHIMNQDGVYVVGTDIARGTWHTAGADTSTRNNNCYYALLASTDTSNIIDNNNVTGPATITVGGNVAAVEVNGCLPWNWEHS